MIKVVRASQHREMPWKNGGGVTTEIAIYPPGAGLEDFDWRVSIALMARAGRSRPSRASSVALRCSTGAACICRAEAAEPPIAMMATRSADPLVFTGDVPVEARVVDGMVTVLNVMTRRGRYRQELERIDLDGTAGLALTAPIALFLCRDGQRLDLRRRGDGDARS